MKRLILFFSIVLGICIDIQAQQNSETLVRDAIKESAGGAAIVPAKDLPIAVKVPNGFRYEVLAEGDIPEPLDLKFSPDGLLWFTGRAGDLWVLNTETKAKTHAGKIAVDHSDDRGLHGMAFHPGFLTNGYVYCYYSPHITNGSANRISRFTIENPGQAGHLLTDSEVVLLEFPTDKSGQHQGGAVAYDDRDGKLYVSTGDNNVNTNLAQYFDDPENRAQNLSDLRGKILRLNLDGSIPSDNPFANQSGKRGEIYTRGHRQPYTLHVDSQSGRVFEGENGGDRPEDFEEINLLQAGGNYGWPRAFGDNIGQFGGKDPLPGALAPWLTYQHFTAGSSCTCGPVYRATHGKYVFPGEYRDGLFYGDYVRRWIRFAQINPQTGTVIKTEPFANALSGGPLAIEQGPDGALYIAEYHGGTKDRISRIIYTGEK